MNVLLCEAVFQKSIDGPAWVCFRPSVFFVGGEHI